MISDGVSADLTSSNQWALFTNSLLDFLASISQEDALGDASVCIQELYDSCPEDLSAVGQAQAVQALITSEVHCNLLDAIRVAISDENEVLALFLIGMCELDGMGDEILDEYLDLVHQGINLNTLVTSFTPRNVFEVNALVSLMYWPEFPDWARALLVIRDDVGLSVKDRDSILEYLGNPDILGADTLVAISGDISNNQHKYSAQAADALKTFFQGNLDTVSEFCGSDSDELEGHLDALGAYCVGQCKRSLAIS